MRVLIAGCGYVGLALGRHLAATGHAVAGIRRPGRDPAALLAAGIQPIGADLTRPADVARLPRAWDWVVLATAPDASDEAGYRAAYLEAARALVGHLRGSPPGALVFTGSTSVYAQTDGSEVDEASPAEPAAPTARVLRETEDFLANGAVTGFPAIRLRIAGIYGPGRHRLEAVRRGEARITGGGRRWVNVVHRDDLVTAIVAALARGRAGAVYNVADGAPATEREFLGWLHARLGCEVPPAEATLPPGSSARGRAWTDKRVAARRIREELGWQPRFPSFREGYEALIREEQGAG